MAHPDLETLRAHVRRRYELGRVWSALRAAALLAIPFAALAALSPQVSVAVAGLLTAWSFALYALWRGLSLGAGVLPGVVCGAMPLATSHLAAKLGHLCLGDGCYSTCAPLCAGGGLAAGLILAHWIRHQPRPSVAFASGSIFVVAIGATGCTCLGLGGVAGIAVGLVAGAIPVGLRGLKVQASL